MTWRAPSFRLSGLELARASLTTARRTRKDHGPEWVIFSSPFATPSGDGVIIGADYHQVLDGVLLGCTVHAQVTHDGVRVITQELADEAAEVLGPWLCDALWDFMGSHLRSLASTSQVDFDIPRKAPEPKIEKLAERSNAAAPPSAISGAASPSR